jgi:hypothetical protein
MTPDREPGEIRNEIASFYASEAGSLADPYTAIGHATEYASTHMGEPDWDEVLQNPHTQENREKLGRLIFDDCDGCDDLKGRAGLSGAISD